MYICSVCVIARFYYRIYIIVLINNYYYSYNFRNIIVYLLFIITYSAIKRSIMQYIHVQLIIINLAAGDVVLSGLHAYGVMQTIFYLIRACTG